MAIGMLYALGKNEIEFIALVCPGSILSGKEFFGESIMSFLQGLSGLGASSMALDVTSNNIANSGTVGFKTSATHFADLFADSLSRSGASQIGIGTTVSAVQQKFVQGNITTTNNPLDVAINGGGFFRMSQNLSNVSQTGAITYTRNGQFHLNNEGYIVNDQGLQLTGYPAGLQLKGDTSTLSPLQVSAADLPARATQNFKTNINLDARMPVNNTWVDGGAAGSTAAFSPNPSTYQYSTAVSVYDSLGNPHNLTMYFAKSNTIPPAWAAAGATAAWNVYGSVDGTTNLNINGTGAIGGPFATLWSDSSGRVMEGTSGTGSGFDIGIDLNAVASSLKSTNGAKSPLTINMDFSSSTQYGSSFGVNSMQQDGYASGHLVDFAINADGIVQGRYSNGETLSQGQVVLANFTNMNGLKSLGNNQWAETAASGPAVTGTPNTSTLGVLQASAVEDSTVDLTKELVDMITQQRNYQANAQSIKTQDSVLQTLVNLR